jgi:hypothetical protein
MSAYPRTAAKWVYASLIAQILIGAYLPLSNLAPFAAIAFGGVPPLLFLLAYRKRIRFLMVLCLAHYLAWLGLEVKNTWLPHFSGRHPAPDAAHLVLEAALVTVVVPALAGLWKLDRESPTFFPLWVFR